MSSDLAAEAKQTLIEFVPQIDSVLKKIWIGESTRIFGLNERQKTLALDMVGHAMSHNLAPSKRIRSAFVVNSYRLGNKETNTGVWQAAAAVELVHTALLMHDDFMDEDMLRRGKETTNAAFSVQYGKHYGDTMAVNIGDMVLSLGYETLVGCGLAPELVVAAMGHLQRSILNTVIGQAHDCTMGYWDNWTEDDVLAVHTAKTSLYSYENPLFVGAILAGLTDQVKVVLHEYALAGGVAFQIQDDILGVFGNPEETGKSADSDLLQGKRTLLALKTIEMGTPEQVVLFKKVFGNKQATEAELVAAKKAIFESGALDYNREKAKELAGKAAVTAEKLRDLPVNTEAVDFIQGVAEYMVNRKV